MKAATSRAAELEQQVKAAEARADESAALGERLTAELEAATARAAEASAARDKLTVDLETAASWAAELEEQVRSARERADESAGAVPNLRQQEDLIRDSIITAQKAANEVREEARRNASDVLRSARRRAEQIVAEAHKERERLTEEITRLEEHTETSRAALSDFLTSLLDRVRPEPELNHAENSVAPDAAMAPAAARQVVRHRANGAPPEAEQ